MCAEGGQYDPLLKREFSDGEEAPLPLGDAHKLSGLAQDGPLAPLGTVCKK